MIPDESKVVEEKVPETETTMINTTDSKKKNGSKGGKVDPPAKKTK